MRVFYFLGLLLMLGMSACQSDDEVIVEDDGSTVAAKYGEGIYIINEGPFGNGTGTIGYFNRAERTIQNDVFQTENNGAVLGNIAQSMIIDGDDAYIVVNNANKVTHVDAGSMQYIQDIEGLALPRYIQASNDKLYISQWGANGLEGSVAVYNTTNSTVETTIATGSGAERMQVIGNKLYVANSGGFGRDSTIAIIDTNSDELTTSILVGDNPTSIVSDNTGAIWVICKGFTDWYEPSLNTAGKLVKIVDDEVVLSLEVANGADDLVISPEGDALYFSAGGQVLKHFVADSELAAIPMLIDRNFYALGVDVNGNIIASDAKDFVSNGEVVIYNNNGQELESFEVGLIPGNFFVK